MTEIQTRILACIRASDHTLSLREIMAAADISSTSVVRAGLHRLAALGYVELSTNRQARGYRIPNQDEELLRECQRVLEVYVVNDLPILDRLRERLS